MIKARGQSLRALVRATRRKKTAARHVWSMQTVQHSDCAAPAAAAPLLPRDKTKQASCARLDHRREDWKLASFFFRAPTFKVSFFTNEFPTPASVHIVVLNVLKKLSTNDAAKEPGSFKTDPIP